MACIASGEGERKCTLGGDRCGSGAGLATDEGVNGVNGVNGRPGSAFTPSAANQYLIL